LKIRSLITNRKKVEKERINHANQVRVVAQCIRETMIYKVQKPITLIQGETRKDWENTLHFEYDRENRSKTPK